MNKRGGEVRRVELDAVLKLAEVVQAMAFRAEHEEDYDKATEVVEELRGVVPDDAAEED